MKDDIVLNTNGVTQQGTQRTWTYSPIFSVAWTPRKAFTIRGDFESNIIVDPYVALRRSVPSDPRFGLDYKPNDKWGIDNVCRFII